MKDKLYKMRDDKYTKGLIDLINYVIDDYKSNITMIEIGSYTGESTMLFAKKFKKVISVDPFINNYDLNDIACKYMNFEDVYNFFLKNISKYSNIEHIRKTSDDAISDLEPIKFDLVYIDGLHTYEQVKRDIENYLPLIKKGGYISGHDYHPVWQGVIDAIHEKIGKPDFIFQDTSWIKKIN
jgi:predicted O-methyltransferase YrrM